MNNPVNNGVHGFTLFSHPRLQDCNRLRALHTREGSKNGRDVMWKFPCDMTLTFCVQPFILFEMNSSYRA